MAHKHTLTKSAVMAIALLSLSLGTSHVAYAQINEQIGEATGIADPGRIQDQFKKTPLTPSVSPRVEVKDIILQEAPDGAESIMFTLNTVEIEGAQSYTIQDLEPVYATQLGQEVSLSDVYLIARKLTNKYRNNGYILTQVIVPPQTIENGRIKFRVVEGFLNNITVEGNADDSALTLIRKYAAKIKTGNALNTKDLERYLLLINDLPGVEARSILSPSPTLAGAADLRILVERDPYDALIAVDNFGSRFLGPVQFSAFGAANSFFGNNERITGQFVIAPDNGAELLYGSISYTHPLWSNGTKLELTATQTSTNPGFSLAQFHVKGNSQLFSAKILHPFVRSRVFNVSGRLGFDWRDVDSKNDLEPTREDRIRTIRMGGNVEFLDTLLGFGINAIDLELSQGIKMLAASDDGDIRLTRPAGDPQFTKLNAEIQRLQHISSNINLLLAAKGQLASHALLSSEEFGVGGSGYGRGYDPSEIVGDNGIAGKVEVQWNEPYKVPIFNDYQLYSFFDAGRVWNDDSTTNDLERESISSTGMGIRADFTADTKAGLGVAVPLTRNVDTRNDRGLRIYVNMQHTF